MYGPYYILLLFVFLIASGLCEQQRSPTEGASHAATEPADWRRTNTMSLEPDEDHEEIRSSGDFSLDNPTLSQDRIHGSGDGPVRSGSEDDEREDGQEDEDGSGFEGSGHYPVSGLTVCQRAATEASENPASKYIPLCNKKGAFTAHQCDKNLADCWCVDSNGKEIAGSRRTHPMKARCSHKDRHPYVIEGRKTGQAEPDSETPSPVDDDIIIETPKDGSETKQNADISTLNTDSEQGNDLETKQPINRPSIIRRPGMLAGVICGAVVGLLCAVLLVMFIVYRMRKKDEGSYALDEPKRSPSLTYTKASKDREFFA